MHELALSKAIVDTALRHCDGRKVTVVRTRVGALRQVVPHTLRFNFQIVTRGTQCEGAMLEFERIAARLRCLDCGSEWDPAPPPAAQARELVPPASFRCPRCGAGESEVIAGEELEIESIDVEEEPCIAPG